MPPVSVNTLKDSRWSVAGIGCAVCLAVYVAGTLIGAVVFQRHGLAVLERAAAERNVAEDRERVELARRARENPPSVPQSNR